MCIALVRGFLPDRKGRLKPSRWRMTEAQAQASYLGCTKVEHSLEVRVVEPYKGHSMASGLVRNENGALLPPPMQARHPWGNFGGN